MTNHDQPPALVVNADVATLTVPGEGYALDFRGISLGKHGGIYAEVTARHGATALHTVRINLLNPRDQETFYQRCMAVNSNTVDWQSWLQSALPGLRELATGQNGQATPMLLVFDPVQSFFGRRIDMNSASDTRPVLDAVAALCKQYRCTPLFVRHIGKTRRERALYAGLGSIDITARMRSELFLGEDPDNDQRRILAHSKANNGRMGPSLAYKIVSVDHDLLTPTEDLVTVEAPRLDWDGLSPLTATNLASPPLTNDEEVSALDQAREFLRELLTDGPLLADEVSKAAKQAGMAMATLRRAKPLLGVTTRRRNLENVPYKQWPWEWLLDESTGSPPPIHILMSI
jgi:hypothetical protein